MNISKLFLSLFLLVSFSSSLKCMKRHASDADSNSTRTEEESKKPRCNSIHEWQELGDSPDSVRCDSAAEVDDDLSLQDKFLNACSGDDVQKVIDLLDKGADVNYIPKLSCYTPLTSAISNGNTEIINLLLERGAEVNAFDENHSIPLITAASYGRTEVVKALLAKGADVNAVNKYGSTAVMIAAQNDYAETLNAIFKEKGKEVNIPKNIELCLVYILENDTYEDIALPENFARYSLEVRTAFEDEMRRRLYPPVLAGTQ